MGKKYLTISSSDMLGGFDFTVDLKNSVPRTTETVLVAPTERMAKEWRKMYPGIKVVLQTEYTGYPLPTDLTNYLGIQKVIVPPDAERLEG